VRIGLVAVALAVGAAGPGMAAPRSRAASERPGVAPDTPWSCPTTHPIKGYVSVESGRRVYYVPGSRFYEEASPERCYASEEEARDDGSRRAPDSIPPARIPGVVERDDGGRTGDGRDNGGQDRRRQWHRAAGTGAAALTPREPVATLRPPRTA